MIEMTLGEIVQAAPTISSIMEEKTKARTAFLIARIAKKVKEECDLFDEAREKLIYKYGEKDSSGELVHDYKGNYHIQKEDIAVFNQEMQQLLATKIELEIDYITLEDLEDLSISPKEILAIEKMIKK